MDSMGKIGNSTIWEFKYTPTSIKDLIIPEQTKSYLLDCVSKEDIPNLLLYSSPGRGKTSTAYALCHDIGAEYLYINGSMETSIEVLRNKVTQFATSFSMDGCKKTVIMDESDRISSNAADSIKGLLDQVVNHCRFIFTTNNFSKIIDPIKSRCHIINFDFSKEESKKLMVLYFKRLQWILNNESVTYDKKILAEFVQNNYPDFRKTLNKLQMAVKTFGCIDERVLSVSDSSKVNSLIDEMKNKKWNGARKIISEMDFTTFYSDIYTAIEPHLKDECKPSVILELGEWAWKSGLSNDKELACVCCMTSLIKEANWK